MGANNNNPNNSSSVSSREYTCGCGKSYLSAAALYTHVKQKHEGVNPKDTDGNQIATSTNSSRTLMNSKPSKSKVHLSPPFHILSQKLNKNSHYFPSKNSYLNEKPTSQNGDLG